MEKRCIFCMEKMAEGQDLCPLCGKSQKEYAQNPKHLAPHTMLQGRYLIGAVLGAGGFGVTYTGYDTVLDHRVAVKEFFPARLAARERNGLDISPIEASQELFERQKQSFRTESSILAGLLGTPGICNVTEYFEENKTAYLVEEYLPGKSLNAYLKDLPGHKIPWEECKALFQPVLDGLCRIHSAGIVHCDISPDNLLFDGDGKLKLIDFGAAKQFPFGGDDGSGGGQAVPEKEDSVALTENYAAPELYGDGKKTGPWTDLYAICAVLYTSLTGEKPLPSLARIKHPKPLSLSQYAAVGQEAEAAILQGMEPDIQKRYFYTGILMDRLGMDVHDAKLLTGQFRNQWGDRWLEIFMTGTSTAKNKSLLARFSRRLTRSQKRRLLAAAAGLAGIGAALYIGFFAYAQAHPEETFRRMVNRAQKKAAAQEIPVIEPGTKRFEEFLDTLSQYKRTDYGEETRYDVPPSFLKENQLPSNCYDEFYLDLSLAERIIGYYFGRELSVESTDNQCFVMISPGCPPKTDALVENSYRLPLADGSSGTLSICYDFVTMRVCSISIGGQKDDISLFLRDVFPYIVPETYLTDDEIEGLFSQLENDPEEPVWITNHAKFDLLLSCPGLPGEEDGKLNLNLTTQKSSAFVFR